MMNTLRKVCILFYGNSIIIVIILNTDTFILAMN